MASFRWQLAVILCYLFRNAAAQTQPLSKAQSQLFMTSKQLFSSISGSLHRSSRGQAGIWDAVQITLLCGSIPVLWFLGSWWKRRGESWRETQELRCSAPVNDCSEEALDPGLLKKHSEFKSYTTDKYTYSSIRTFYRRHPQADKLPVDPAPLPLLVFIHGLGGSVAQFHPLLTSLVNVSSCLAIDLPGCGLSKFSPRDWNAYTTDALVELLAVVIEEYRDKDAGQGVVLIGHSMGCSFAAQLASPASTPSKILSNHVMGLVAICPKAEPPTEQQVAGFKKLLLIPGVVFDLWRRWDRRGGTESASVKRFVGIDADLDSRKLQMRFNEQSRTPVWRRMASGSLPIYNNGVPMGGLPGSKVWARLGIPLYLVAGEADHITRAAELDRIAEFLGNTYPTHVETDEHSEPIVDSAAPVDTSTGSVSKCNGDDVTRISEGDFADRLVGDAEHVHEDPSTPHDEVAAIPPQPLHPKKVLRTTILPAPANHAMLYMPSTSRILAGLVADFLSSHVSPRLSLGWQLQFLSTSGKWDVKNLEKWQAVAPVSKPIAGIFRAMKTLREVDDVHCPEVFVHNWGDQIKDIIDISHESPVYDPRGLEKGGIRYHKLPTVSKIPPTGAEVKEFITFVDRLIDEQKARRESEGWTQQTYIGVHCHYGFNRTGYFIVCYLIERCGLSVKNALDEFAKKRPNGIKHAHFMDQLFVRYCVGLKREDMDKD